MRKALLALVLLVPFSALAQTWEYKVVYLAVPISGSSMPKVKTEAIKAENGYHTNTEINATLNALGSQGWELIGVTGNNISQTAFLRRRTD